MPRLIYAEELDDGTTALIVQYGDHAIGGVAMMTDLNIEFERSCSRASSFVPPLKNVETIMRHRFIWYKVVDVDEFRRSRGWERGPESALPTSALAIEYRSSQ